MIQTNRDDIQHAIAALVSELEAPGVPAKVDASTSLFQGGLELDSFLVVELIDRIEDRFAIVFEDADFAPERFTVGGLAEIVERHLAGRS